MVNLIPYRTSKESFGRSRGARFSDWAHIIWYNTAIVRDVNLLYVVDNGPSTLKQFSQSA